MSIHVLFWIYICCLIWIDCVVFWEKIFFLKKIQIIKNYYLYLFSHWNEENRVPFDLKFNSIQQLLFVFRSALVCALNFLFDWNFFHLFYILFLNFVFCHFETKTLLLSTEIVVTRCHSIKNLFSLSIWTIDIVIGFKWSCVAFDTRFFVVEFFFIFFFLKFFLFRFFKNIVFHHWKFVFNAFYNLSYWKIKLFFPIHSLFSNFNNWIWLRIGIFFQKK